MQTSNRFFDDLSRVASGAASAFSGLRDEVDQMIRQRLKRVIADMDMVTREEFEAVEAIATKAREEQEKLSEKVAALEAELGKLKKPAAKSGATAKKPAAKTATKAAAAKAATKAEAVKKPARKPAARKTAARKTPAKPSPSSGS